MIVFSLIFVVYLSEKWRLPAQFAESARHLDFRFGLMNTLILLTSSLFMALAVHGARLRQVQTVRTNLLMCLLFGLCFCVSKGIEYSLKIDAGFTPAHSPFFSFYYFMTGAHLLHVVAGLVFISHFWRSTALADDGDGFTKRLEAVGLFWHFVDLVWLFIFPLLYLAGGMG
jgi:nitric oxide reductase NorE protein